MSRERLGPSAAAVNIMLGDSYTLIQGYFNLAINGHLAFAHRSPKF